MDALFEFITANGLASAVVGALGALLLAIGGGVIWIARAIGGLSARLDALTEGQNRLWDAIGQMRQDISRLDRAVVAMAAQLADHDRRISILEKNMEGVWKFLDTKFPGEVVPYMVRHSPYRLTDEGNRVAEFLGVEAFLDRHMDVLRRKFDELNEDDTAYDIEEACYAIARHDIMPLMTREERVRVKNKAYVDDTLLDFVLKIYGVLLRERIVAERGGDNAPNPEDYRTKPAPAADSA